MRVGSAAAASLLHPHAAAVLGPPALAALLRPQIFPISSVVAPCQPGASAPSVRRRIYKTDHLGCLRGRRGSAALHLDLRAMDGTPIFVLGERHPALDAHPDSRLRWLALPEQTLQQGHVPSRP